MNWDAIGAVGEIIGALAVFITLAYLAIQIRQNTKAVQSSALDSSFNRISQIRHSLAENPELAKLYIKGNQNPEDLDESETLQYRMLLHNMFMSQSNIYFQTRFTDLPIATWESQASVISRAVSSPGGKWFWKSYGKEFESDFQSEIERIISESE